MAKKEKLTDAGQVALYMENLSHPLKTEIEALRGIIKNCSEKISERIKWNAPSYYYKEDIVTFGPPARSADKILLVFHHPHVVTIKSPLLEGDYKDRRLAYFKNMQEIEENRTEIAQIINTIVAEIDKTQNL